MEKWSNGIKTDGSFSKTATVFSFKLYFGLIVETLGCNVVVIIIIVGG